MSTSEQEKTQAFSVRELLDATVSNLMRLGDLPGLQAALSFALARVSFSMLIPKDIIIKQMALLYDDMMKVVEDTPGLAATRENYARQNGCKDVAEAENKFRNVWNNSFVDGKPIISSSNLN